MTDSPALDPQLQSGILTSPADGMLSDAIRKTLLAPATERATLFETLVLQIQSEMAARRQERPWTCQIYRGEDGSFIFRGGIGHSLVIDPEGRLWRARSYEDFETEYHITASTCEIRNLRPLYHQMRQYLT